MTNNNNENNPYVVKYFSSHYLSAAIMLKSGRIGNVRVLLRNEKETSLPTTADMNNSINNNADDSSSSIKSKRSMENYTRLALLITQIFINAVVEKQVQELDSSSSRNFASTIQLGDFFINFDHEHSSNHDGIITLMEGDMKGGRSPSNMIEAEEPSTSPNTKKSSIKQDIQALGKILYSVFCHGQPLPEDILEVLSSQEADEHSDPPHGSDEFPSFSTGRATRRLRATQKTIFGTLIESKSLPKAICRFLADMMDTKSEKPFASFQDVMLDLKQMISQPMIFLHDDAHYSPAGSGVGLHFGQKYYSRKEEVTTLMKLVIQIMDPSIRLTGVQATFISGIAGSGKSSLAQCITANISSLSGWIVINAKFERNIEHASRGIVSSMFNEIINHLVKMKESGIPAEVAYSQNLSKSILDSIGADKLSGLVDFLPSLPLLFDDIVRVHAENANWQLPLALKVIIGAVLESGKYLMICCDDLQWADKVSFSLLSEVLINVGHEHSHHCLFMGMFRSNETDNNHSFYIQYSKLRDSRSISVAEEIKLSNLSKEDVICMMMAEFRLPRRIVAELAEEVYKKTTGHAFFVVELLNSLLRDSVITYSTEKCCYDWEDPVIIATGNTVAELIATNLKSLAPESLQILQILSCFGIQTGDSLLQILETYHKGIKCSIDGFVEMGILDQAGPIVIFSHDLVHEEAYRSMTHDEGKTLHMKIGQFLGATVDAPPLALQSVTRDFGQLQVEDQPIFSGRNMKSTLISLSCDQVNAAGPDYVIHPSQMNTCAKWNLSAGQSFAFQANYSAAQYYFTNGISFLAQDSWSIDQLLCLQLHQGVVLSSFAIGDADKVDQYAQKVIDNVPFENTLDVQAVVLKSLCNSERHEECVSRGIAILRRLGFQIPLAPTPQSIGMALASATIMASQYSSDQIASLCRESKDDSTYDVVRITDALYISAQTISSPFVPLIACEAVNFSLQNGCCPEAAMSFATIAWAKVFFESNLVGGKLWSVWARIILESTSNTNISSVIRTEIMLHLTIDNYFEPIKHVASKLDNCYLEAMKIGQSDCAIMALIHVWRFRLWGGYNLSLIMNNFEERLELTAKHSIFCAQFMTLDAMILMDLTGIPIDCSSVPGYSVSNTDDDRFENESSKDDRSLFNFCICKMYICYWRGNLIEAEEHSQQAWTYPISKNPQCSLIYHTFYSGLIALQLHRQVGGNNDQRLKRGEAAMKKFETWANKSMAVFANKWLLLQAEYSTSVGEHDKAQLLYLASINAAKDHGNIHELALAHELLGNYYCAREQDSNECFRTAVCYYEQWGATVLAKKLKCKLNLSMDPGTSEKLQLGTTKHPRIC